MIEGEVHAYIHICDNAPCIGQKYFIIYTEQDLEIYCSGPGGDSGLGSSVSWGGGYAGSKLIDC